MMMKWFALLVVLSLGACTTAPRTSSNAPDSAAPRAATDLTMKLDLTPRVGLFNTHQYAHDGGQNNGKWDRNDYLALISPELKPAFPTSWEVLLTKETDTAATGYQSRQITITVTGGKPSIQVIRCRFILSDAHGDWHEEIRNCSWRGRIGNTQALLEGEISYRDETGAEFLVPVIESVPEDFLLVSLGDSYASGEGNPDRQRSTEIGIDGATSGQQAAVWMDERCHRSAWAGPLQAGLRLAREPVTKFAASSDRLAVSVSGAYTVASVACSGATIEKGVIGRYAGRLSLAELARNDRRVRDELSYYFERMQDLETQTKQIRSLLADQGKSQWTKKSDIDALVISTGGNDVYFAELLTSMVLEKLDGRKAQEPLNNFLNNALDKLNNQENGYPALDRAIAAPGLNNTALPVRQVLITEYPDPTRQRPCKDLADLDCYCSGPISKGFYGALSRLFKKGVDARESQTAKTKILDRLNGVITEQGDTFGWLVLKHEQRAGGENDIDFATHGWCGDKAYGAPYKKQQAWFRDLEDSEQYQGDFFGTMHPTWQAHESYRNIIYAGLVEGIKSETKIELRSSAEPVDGKRYYKPPLRVCFTNRENKAASLHSLYLNGKLVPHEVDGDGCLQITDESRNITLIGKDAAARRAFLKSFNGLIADQSIPLIECKLMRRSNKAAPAMTSLCADVGASEWIRDPNAELRVGVSDKGSGLKTVTWAFTGGSSPENPLSATSNEAQHFVLPLPEGRIRFSISALDRVDNPSDSVYYFNVDHTAPRLISVSIHGATLSTEQVIPLSLGAPSRLRLSIAEDESGLQSLHWLGQPIITDRESAHGFWLAQISIRPRLSNSLFEQTLAISDLASNRTRVALKFVGIQASDVSPAGPGAWKSMLDGKHAKVRQLARVVELLSGSPLPQANEARNDWPLLAGWFNLADGRIAPNALLPLATKDCIPLALGETTVFTLLVEAEKCQRAGAFDSRLWHDAFVSAGLY